MATSPNIVQMPAVVYRKGYEVAQAARETVFGDGTPKAVLLYLANAADKKGWTFTSFNRVVRETEFGDRTVTRVLQIFAELGLVTHTRLTKAAIEDLRRAGGDVWSEEFQINLRMLGEDFTERYAAIYKRIAGKKTAEIGVAVADVEVVPRVKSKPGRKVVPATDNTQSENATDKSVAATEINVAATNPLESLSCITPTTPPYEHPALDTAQGVSLDRRLDAAVPMVCATLGWVGAYAQKTSVPACREAMEVFCRETGAAVQDAAELVIAGWRENCASDRALVVPAVWFGGGRWLADGERARMRKASTERQASEAASFRGDGPECSLPVAADPAAKAAWKRVLAVLEQRINLQSFNTWLRPTSGFQLEGHVLHVRIPSTHFQHLGDRYSELIEEAISGLGMAITEVRFSA